MKYISIAISVIVIGVIGFATVKKLSPVGWGLWGTTNTSSGTALHGYDPVSYFDDGAPVRGEESFTFEWHDAVWQFSSDDNKERFAASPDQFAPQFGGFCAFAVAEGFTADASPDAWHIEGDSLYVFADENVRYEWVAALRDGSLERARENWAKR